MPSLISNPNQNEGKPHHPYQQLHPGYQQLKGEDLSSPKQRPYSPNSDHHPKYNIGSNQSGRKDFIDKYPYESEVFLNNNNHEMQNNNNLSLGDKTRAGGDIQQEDEKDKNGMNDNNNNINVDSDEEIDLTTTCIDYSKQK